MPLDAPQVGTNLRLAILVGDPSVASQFQGVVPVADATNVAGKFAGLDYSAQALKNPITNNLDVARAAPGTTGVQAVSPEGTKNTFSCAVSGITLAATATDFVTVIGSGTTTVRVLKVTISGFATAGASPDILLIKRSTADTGGTASTPALVPNDSNNSPATSVVSIYSVNPSGLGTAVGTIRARKLNLGAAGAAGTIEWKFSDTNDQAIVLRGIAQTLALNFNGQAVPSGTTIDVEIEFVEDNS